MQCSRQQISLFKQLEEFSRGSLCILGVGNRMRGDDGAGSLLIDKIKGRAAADCIDAGVAPENFLEKAARGGFDAVLIVDTADFGGTPGEMRIFDIEAVAGGSLSTHAISLPATADYLKARCSARIVFLAFQGQTMDLGEGPGKAVSEAVDLLAETLSKLRLKCTNPAAGQPTL